MELAAIAGVSQAEGYGNGRSAPNSMGYTEPGMTGYHDHFHMLSRLLSETMCWLKRITAEVCLLQISSMELKYILLLRKLEPWFNSSRVVKRYLFTIQYKYFYRALNEILSEHMEHSEHIPLPLMSIKGKGSPITLLVFL